ncbi:biotin transporter BioY [Bifidobacterium cuniculi]|uniref:Biotin transporter n=1 Tax=Bifidobacterium cuniculi TaxID=1688 RepID=A0A087AY63_9BIFI|nr:biotin transporter BioY [Bifidobacterium cuniculi]KFI63713.1 biotin biosynthesis protein BioY [Bifidobacterium cuniculi]
MRNTSMTFPSRLTMRTVVRNVAPPVALALGLWAASAFGRIPVPGTVVPITLQTFVLMVGALLLPTRQATAGVACYLAMGAVGLPVFSGGGSTAALLGPSAGFLLGFLPAAAVTAALRHAVDGAVAPRSSASSRPADAPRQAAMRGVRRTAGYLAAAVLGCIVVSYLCGFVVQAAVLHLPLGAVAVPGLAFLPGDLAKAVAATLMVAAVRR